MMFRLLPVTRAAKQVRWTGHRATSNFVAITTATTSSPASFTTTSTSLVTAYNNAGCGRSLNCGRSHNGHHALATAAAACLALCVAGVTCSNYSKSTKTLCEEQPSSPSSLEAAETASLETSEAEKTTDGNSSPLGRGTPLWPNGVSEQDIDDLVDEILKDPNVNIPLLPDALERRIYKSTIALTLNSFYGVLASIDGQPFLSHQIKVKRVANSVDHKERTKIFLAEQSKNVNVKVLEEVADRLLANPAINASFVPDRIERQIYSRCMIVIFRVLTVLFSSFRVTVCGHDFGLSMEPAVFETVAKNMATANSSLSRIDVEKLRQYAESSCGVPGDRDTDAMTEGWSLWDRIWNRQEFMAQLHASLYALILGIMDDIMANTRLRILSDDIILDVVPLENFSTDRPFGGDDNGKSSANDSGGSGALASDNDSGSNVSVAYFSSATFIAGLGLGLTLSAILNEKR